MPNARLSVLITQIEENYQFRVGNLFQNYQYKFFYQTFSCCDRIFNGCDSESIKHYKPITSFIFFEAI